MFEILVTRHYRPIQFYPKFPAKCKGIQNGRKFFSPGVFTMGSENRIMEEALSRDVGEGAITFSQKANRFLAKNG
jgi:hypothetical protein